MSPVSANGVDHQGVYINGEQVKQALDAANETVDEGVYDPTTLSAVDADLATANIKNGITIFGKLGTLVEGTDISDADAVVGGVKQGQTFYSVAEPRKTGTMPTVAIVAANDNYPAGYHAGNVGGLDAIDVHLAEGNIKLGVNIFGKVGTLVSTLAEDVLVEDWGPVSDNVTYFNETLDNLEDFVLASITETFDTSSFAVAAAFLHGRCDIANNAFKARLYMGGTQVAESGYLRKTSEGWSAIMLKGTRALSGSQTVKLTVYNYGATGLVLYIGYTDVQGHQAMSGVVVGSVKAT